MRPVVIASNMFEEIGELQEWFDCFQPIADGGILIVDSGSKDGTVEFCKEKGAAVVVNDTIRNLGYGPARNELRKLAKSFFPNSHWLCYFDADERVDEKEFHQFRYLKDYLVEAYDVIAFPRIDWHNKGRTSSQNNYKVAPDWQARMTRLDSPLSYVRRLHEQIQGFRAIYNRLSNPKINHFHRSASKEKRDLVGKLCAKLHMEDSEWGHTVPEHPKEAVYRERYIKEGL